MLRHLDSGYKPESCAQSARAAGVQLTHAGLTFPRRGGMNVTTYANRYQIPTPSRSCGLGARDRWLAGVLAGWLGQMADVLHRDGNEDTDCCQEEAENGGLGRAGGLWWPGLKRRRWPHRATGSGPAAIIQLLPDVDRHVSIMNDS